MGVVRSLGLLHLLLAPLALASPEEVWTVVSPSGAVSMTVTLAGGSLRYYVLRDGLPLIESSALGLVRADTGFTSGLTFLSQISITGIDESYTQPHGKTSSLHNLANERTLEFSNGAGKKLQVVIRAYEDGAAFRYRFPETSPSLFTVTDEQTSFTIAADGRAVLQSHFPETLHTIVPTEAPPAGAGWALPALFDLGTSWVMLAESDVSGSYFAAWLDSGAANREYRIRLPDSNYGTREPSSTLPWEMPWRVIIVGPDAGSVIESNLVTHLGDPCQIQDTSWILPGRVSWHWWSGAFVGNMGVLEDYVDLAEEMGWEYSLVDADWDQYYTDAELRGLVAYAAARGVGIFFWYNAAGPQNSNEFTPRDRMWDTAIRRAEMAKLSSWGVKGVKVDFFDSDKQAMMKKYLAILEDAASAHLLVNFHGSTPPRGWCRAWPNMMSTEAVRGAEYYLIDPNFAAQAPPHNVRLAFTRNVVGPMDYTPVTFSDRFYAHVTTNAHELALSVLFESGLLHMADKSSSYRAQPQVVRAFLSGVPAAWDEIRFVEGDPATHVVLARRRGSTWYLAGINGTNTARGVSVDLTQFGYEGVGGDMIGDGATPREFATEPLAGVQLDVTMAPRGGFVARVPSSSIGVADGVSGGAMPLVLDLPTPNPFTDRTVFRYALPAASRARVVILDAAGRRIRALAEGAVVAGPQVVAWDGRDDRGAAVPAGVYICRVVAGSASAARTVTRVR